MQLVTKKEFEENLQYMGREQIIEMLYKAYIELIRIQYRTQSIWYMKDFMYRDGRFSKE